MLYEEVRAVFWLCLLGLLVSVFYRLVEVPLPQVESGVFALIVAGWYWKRYHASFAEWRTELRDMFRVAIYFVMAVAVMYFLTNLFMGKTTALVIAGLLTLYLASFYYVALVLILNERYEQAHRFLNTMLAWFPDDSRLHTQKAQAYYAEERFEEAIEAATRAIEAHVGSKEKAKKVSSLNEQTIHAYSVRVSSYIRLADGDNALRDAELFVRAMPEHVNGYFNRGTALLYLEEYKAAQADFNRIPSTALQPYYQAIVENNRGLAAYCLRDYTAALAHYTTALEMMMAPHERREFSPIIYTNIATVHFEQNDRQAAWSALSGAHESDPSSIYTLMGFAVLHAAEGQWDEALAIWRSLASRYPFFTDAEEVAQRYYRWTPPMADLVRQIAARASA